MNSSVYLVFKNLSTLAGNLIKHLPRRLWLCKSILGVHMKIIPLHHFSLICKTNLIFNIVESSQLCSALQTFRQQLLLHLNKIKRGNFWNTLILSRQQINSVEGGWVTIPRKSRRLCVTESKAEKGQGSCFGGFVSGYIKYLGGIMIV